MPLNLSDTNLKNFGHFRIEKKSQKNLLLLQYCTCSKLSCTCDPTLCWCFCSNFIYLQPPSPPDIFSEESDTASVASSITTSPKPERKARKKKVFNVQPKIDTNLSPRRKELVAKSSPITKPTLRVPTTLHNSRSRENLSLSPRSREPSPARGGNRWKLLSEIERLKRSASVR